MGANIICLHKYFITWVPNIPSMFALRFSDPLPFGANVGLAPAIVYRYCPEYIEWIMKETEYYFVDVENFKNEADPTPFYSDSQLLDQIQQRFGEFPVLDELTFEYPSVRYALKFIEVANLHPRSHYDQIKEAAKEQKRMVDDLRNSGLDLADIWPDAPPIADGKVEAATFHFSNEALSRNTAKVEKARSK